MAASRFVDDLLGAMPTPEARAAALLILAQHAGTSPYIPVDDAMVKRRKRAAGQLLEQGIEPGDAMRALCVRFHISARTAWRDLHNVRHVSQNGGTTG